MQQNRNTFFFPSETDFGNSSKIDITKKKKCYQGSTIVHRLSNFQGARVLCPYPVLPVSCCAQQFPLFMPSFFLSIQGKLSSLLSKYHWDLRTTNNHNTDLHYFKNHLLCLYPYVFSFTFRGSVWYLILYYIEWRLQRDGYYIYDQ